MALDSREYREAVDLWLDAKSSLDDILNQQDTHIRCRPVKPDPPTKGSPKEYEALRKKVADSRPWSRTYYAHNRRDQERRFAAGIERETAQLWAERNPDHSALKKRYKTALAKWSSKDRDLSYQTGEARIYLSEARRLTEEALAPFWTTIQTHESRKELYSPRSYSWFWRGTILRRHIVDPDSLSMMQDGMVRFIHMDAYLAGNSVEFSPSLSGATSFAETGHPADNVQGPLRSDPIVIGYLLPDRAWASQGHKSLPGKFPLKDEKLCGVQLPIFRPY